MPDVTHFSISWHALLQALNSADESLIEQALWCLSNALVFASKYFVKTVFSNCSPLKQVLLAALTNPKELFGVKQSAMMCFNSLLQANYCVEVLT
jgi:hypothetical protein